MARLLAALRALERAYSSGHHGRWSARRRSGLVDQAVRALAEGLGPRVALVALGGYGRQSLCPGSDIDLMVLHGERRPDRVRAVAERMFYPFWDAGLSLGHAVRTVRECVDGFSDRLDAATALLDARLLWGEEQLFEQLRRRLAREVRRDPSALLGRLEEGRVLRLEIHGSCSQMMEPDLKESTGGLRDIHTVGWANRLIAGARTTRIGDGEGLLRAPEDRALVDAEEFLIRLRSALHLETGKRSDRLFFEYQPGIAELFGFEPGEGLGAADALMRGLFQHTRQVEHLTDEVMGRALLTVQGKPTRQARSHAPSTAEEVMRAFADRAQHGRPLDPDTHDAIEEADLDEVPHPWSEEIRGAFIDLLTAGARERALETMDRMGLLSRFIPEWEAVRCRPQRDPYHQYTVDVHLVRATSEAARLLSGEAEDDVLARAAAAVRDRDALLLGAFLHDIGKTGDGSHVEAGARIAWDVLGRIGVSPSTRDHALFLVRHHLLLSDTATRRDLSDENLVVDVAASVGDPERLAMLYVLTAADAMATGPHAWTPWRQALIRELVGKVEHVLTHGQIGRDAAGDLEARTAALRAALQDEGESAADAYIARLPRAYVLAVPTETAARHLRILGPAIGATDLRTEARPGERGGTYDLTVVAADRPGLLAKIAGALALNGLNILSAQAFTTEDRVALDLFAVEPVFGDEIDEDRWRRFRSDLRKAIEGRVSLEYRVREKRRLYPRPSTVTPTSVTIDNDASDFFTVVEVSAPDRIGLLFDLARAFHELELDVHVAKVATLGSRVVDAFYLRDLYGQKIEEPEHVREIERAVLSRLEDES
ncbi:MAG TPA: ACT domain-containing protein [Actinomycetota bacterium]|nr:ACT domain-containing protein [Actinomycetota bacterium]